MHGWVAAVGCAIGVGAFVLLGAVDRPAPARALPLEARGPREPLVMVFVDSLRHDVATDPSIMPHLARRASAGAAFRVEPCRDRLTYRCLQAALTGVDASSLLDVRSNFRPDEPAAGVTLFDELAARGRRVAAVGANDFARYERAFAARDYFPLGAEEGARFAAGAAAVAAASQDVVVFAMGKGDRVAHEHGYGSAPYRAAFADIDATVEALAARATGNLLVFGDHGHDDAGRHLPGLDCPTFALYHGPAFQSLTGRLEMTDHRVLLGVLLGLPTAPTYGGPALETVFRPEWLAERHPHGLPPLAGMAPAAFSPAWRWALLGSFMLLACALGRLVGRPRQTRLAALLALVTALAGLAYDRLLFYIHDHGDSPERQLSLALPLLAGIVAGAAASRFGARWELRAAAGAVLVPLLLLFPSPNYYGAPRAVVPGAMCGLVLLVVCLARLGRPVRVWAGPAAVSAALLVTFVGVTAADRPGALLAYDLASPLYARWAPATIAACLPVLVFWTERARAPTAMAELLAGVSVWLGIGAAEGWFEQPVAGPVVLCATALLAALSRSVAARIVALTVALLVLYPAARVAGILAILTCLLAVGRLLGRAIDAGAALRSAHAVPFAVAVYFLLWPMIGFRLSGIDFAFVFRWVPAERYVELWWVFAIGCFVKFAVPLWLAIVVSARRLPDARRSPLLPMKIALLAVFGAAYAVEHRFVSRLSFDLLSEIALVTLLVLFVSVSAFFTPAARACAPRGPASARRPRARRPR
jgi:hypothetical protein